MKMSRMERRIVWQMSAGLCSYCTRQTGRKESVDLQFTVDHATPLSRGGKHALANWRPCCLACNELKSDLTEEEFMSIPGDKRERMRAELAQVLRKLGLLGWWEELGREQRCAVVRMVRALVDAGAPVNKRQPEIAV